MHKTIQATFETTDLAEHAAIYLQQHIPHLVKTDVITQYPESLPLDQINRTCYTVYTTAAFSPHNITGTIERPFAIETLLEPFRSQAADLQLICQAESQDAVKKIIIAFGGSQMRIWS